MQFDFNDYVLVQGAFGLNSRSEVVLEYNPIITAPMDTVVDETSAQHFKAQGINICYPRNVKIQPNTEDFISVGLDGFKQLVDGEKNLNGMKICIDVANGNMPLLHERIKDCKEKYPDCIIMAGNVASEWAFIPLAAAGCDYIRVGVGSGSGCLTSVHTGVGQGMATLIQRCAKERKERELKSFIVADGGFRTYRDIIMALAMGADYVMLGGILNKCLESCAPKTVLVNKNQYAEIMYNNSSSDFYTPSNEMMFVTLNEYVKYLSEFQLKFPKIIVDFSLDDLIKEKKIHVNFRGMSTKAVQKDWGREKLQSSEGIEKTNVVEYTIAGWMENFLDYLRSAMSYSGYKTLSDFKQYAEFETISTKTFERFNK